MNRYSKFKPPWSKIWKCTACFTNYSERFLQEVNGICPSCRNDEFEEVFKQQRLTTKRESQKEASRKLRRIRDFSDVDFVDTKVHKRSRKESGREDEQKNKTK